jgi:toxin-antitoxin system PIN domain toxin
VHLLDGNVWVAAIVDSHVHHAPAKAWVDAQAGILAFCRVTQMTFLRLLSNASAMKADVRSRADAWALLATMMRDPRVRLVGEPEGLQDLWKVFSARDDTSHQLWTDDYLAAFALASHATFVTFDRGARARYPSVSVLTLG